MSSERGVAAANLDTTDSSIDLLLRSPLIQQTEIIGTREGGIVDCWVPAGLINHEEVPVKEAWALSLANEMREIAEERGGNGQLSPVILGYIPGEENLKIMDGFHRDAALKMNGHEFIYAAVQLTDWDGLYDVRIFTAKDHAHVRFSRVVQWIREVWEYSGLNDKMKLEQAILLYRFDTDGSKSDLDPETVQAAKAWVARKEEQWDMAAMTILSHLKVAQTVDPQLVHAAREKKKTDVLEAPTQVILKVFADVLPNDFELQNLVMHEAKARNLSGPEVKSLSSKVAGQAPEEARVTISEVDWTNWEPSYGETKQRSLRRAHDIRFKGAAVFSRAAWEIQSVARRANQIVDRNEDIEPNMHENIAQAANRASLLSMELAKLAIGLEKLLPGETENESVRASAETHVAKTEADETVVSEAAELFNESGLRQDILDFLSGDAGIDSVGDFRPKQLVDCFRALDSSRQQPSNWRDRFAELQLAKHAGQLSA